MKPVFLCILFWGLAFVPLHAQTIASDSTKKAEKIPRNEIGFDLVYFLNIFRNQYEPSNTNTFLLAMDRHVWHEKIIRVNLLFGYINNNSKHDSLPVMNNKTVDETVRVGFGWEHPVAKRWEFYYGIDLKYEYSLSNSQAGTALSGTTTSKAISYYYGPAPFTGIKFVINSRMSLTAETNIGLLWFNTTNQSTNDKFPRQNSTTTTTGFNTDYSIPQNVLLNIKF